MPEVVEHQQAPDFELPDQTGTVHRLSAYLGRWVLLYFYPKDDTPGCTQQACVLNEAVPDFSKLHAVVLGISTDSQKSHGKFAAKYDLQFTLLADTERTVVQQYGVWQKKKFMGREYMGTLRTSFLIDPDGRVAKVYTDVKPAGHADEVLRDLAQFCARSRGPQ